MSTITPQLALFSSPGTAIRLQSRPESARDPMTDAFVKGLSRAGADAVDLVAATALTSSPQSVVSGAVPILALAQGFLGICLLTVYAPIDDEMRRPNSAAMERMIGVGDCLTAVGLGVQALTGAASLMPVTIAGVVLTTLGTLGWILKQDS
ncbi:MAG: hypothetical protein HYU64_21670 [Armatimonadetes bacterium]|nr:hypothetical protein [Armatimonadota bacterium]